MKPWTESNQVHRVAHKLHYIFLGNRDKALHVERLRKAWGPIPERKRNKRRALNSITLTVRQ
jgi:hypothetical protein